MSLLLDALKKAGNSRQDTAQNGSLKSGSPELTLESLPNTAQQKAVHQIEDNLARIAGQNLFAAKSPPKRSRLRLSVVPTALISGLVLAAGGAYYVWRETSYTPQLPPPRVAAAAITQPLPVLPPARENKPTAIPASGANLQETPVTRDVIVKQRSPAPARTTGNQPAQGIIVEHGLTADTVDPTLAAAYQSYRDGDFSTAWQLYRTVLQRDAKNRDALLGMAAISQRQGQDATAAQYYGRVLTLDPRDPAAHAGLSALSTEDAASTESRLKLLLTHRPDEAALHFALGNLYAQQSRWGDAQQAYFNAINREPDNAQFSYNFAISLDHLGQSKLAAQHYQRALQLDKSRSAGFDHAQIQKRANELALP